MLVLRPLTEFPEFLSDQRNLPLAPKYDGEAWQDVARGQQLTETCR